MASQPASEQPKWLTALVKVKRHKLEYFVSAPEDPLGTLALQYDIAYIGPDSKFRCGARSKKDPSIRLKAAIGCKEQLAAAKEAVIQLCSSAQDVAVTTIIPNEFHRELIGQEGAVIKSVSLSTGCQVHFSEASRRPNAKDPPHTATIQGPPSKVEEARRALRGLMPLMFWFELPENIDDNLDQIPQALSTPAGHIAVQRGEFLDGKKTIVIKAPRKQASVLQDRYLALQDYYGLQPDRSMLRAFMVIPHCYIGLVQTRVHQIAADSGTVVTLSSNAEHPGCLFVGLPSNVYRALQLIQGAMQVGLQFELSEDSTSRLHGLVYGQVKEFDKKLALNETAKYLCQKLKEAGLSNVSVAVQKESGQAMVRLMSCEATMSQLYIARDFIMDWTQYENHRPVELDLYTPGFDDIIDDAQWLFNLTNDVSNFPSVLAKVAHQSMPDPTPREMTTIEKVYWGESVPVEPLSTLLPQHVLAGSLVDIPFERDENDTPGSENGHDESKTPALDRPTRIANFHQGVALHMAMKSQKQQQSLTSGRLAHARRASHNVNASSSVQARKIQAETYIRSDRSGLQRYTFLNSKFSGMLLSKSCASEELQAIWHKEVLERKPEPSYEIDKLQRRAQEEMYREALIAGLQGLPLEERMQIGHDVVGSASAHDVSGQALYSRSEPSSLSASLNLPADCKELLPPVPQAASERCGFMDDVTTLDELLQAINLTRHAETFRRQEVDLETFLTLNEQQLEELGVSTFGGRKRMMLAIQTMNYKRRATA